MNSVSRATALLITGDLDSVMKVVGLSGSPRRGGNTETLLDTVLRGAEEQGAAIQRFILSELNIHPCRACGGCYEDGQCVIRDDMDLIYRAVEMLDGLVLASPVFFYGVTAQTKAVIDRFQAFWARKYLLRQPIAERRRLGAFVSVGGTEFRNLFEPAKATVRLFFRTVDIEYWDELLLQGIEERKEVVDHPSALRDAEDLGRRIVLAHQEA